MTQIYKSKLGSLLASRVRAFERKVRGSRGQIRLVVSEPLICVGRIFLSAVAAAAAAACTLRTPRGHGAPDLFAFFQQVSLTLDLSRGVRARHKEAAST